MNSPNPAMLDRLLAVSSPILAMPHDVEAFVPLSTPGHRFILGRQGLFKEVRRAWMHAIVCLAPAVLPYGPVTQRFTIVENVPRRLMSEFEAMAHRAAPLHAAPKETAAWVVWDENRRDFELIDVSYAATAVTCEVRRPQLPPHQHLVLDLHSHHQMPAVFSGADDVDDSEGSIVKISGVLGTVYTNPTWSLRLCIEGGLYSDFQKWTTVGPLP